MYHQPKLDGTDLETLPLFSGTPMREPEPKAPVQAEPKQAGFFECHVCRDTGTVKVGGKLKKCWCKSAAQGA